MNALVFLYKRVLHHPPQDRINAIRAAKKVTVPVVMTRDEVAAIIALLDGTPQLVAKLLYGSGLRIMEAVRLRVKDIDYQMKQLTVRSGKGDKDRFTTFPATLTPLLQNHLARVKTLHQQDLAQGHGAVYLPYALAAIHARQHQLQDCLLLNSAGRICDATIANVFWTQNDQLFTPPLSEGGVAGVMRRFLLDNVSGQHTIREQPLTVDSLLQADGVFLTNAVQGIKWVRQYRNRQYSHTLAVQLFDQYLKNLSQ